MKSDEATPGVDYLSVTDDEGVIIRAISGDIFNSNRN